MIRELKWKDMDDIIRNYYSFYDEMENEDRDLGLIFYRVKPDYPSEVLWFSNLYREVLKGDALCFVAEEDGHVVGLCDVRSNRPGSEVCHIATLGIAVTREYRSRGIGRSLLEAIIKACRGKFEVVTLEVFSSNVRAFELYRKIGFRENGKLDKAVKRKGRYYSEIKMYIDLAEF